ncbi:hypothetical protein ABEB36_013054 [Hypothenemus hampei]|uniref:PiggyBac transposable element-derived protein domain-containing protein n=1 Tax=Hypothenemus hampei TaxID=57062 RepID=A0ABD1E6Y9_HYPHA
MINIIVNCTNVQIENERAVAMAQGQQNQTYHHHTDAAEIKAFVAILYHSGLWKTHRVDAAKLWNYGNGVTFYRCVMSYQRFIFLSVCLRFDIKATRDAADRLAPIRELWEIFIGNCTKNYEPSNMCTVDEQLHGFRGRCKHRVYMKSKPDKYGLMLKELNDALTSYMIFAIPYLGKTHGVSNGESIPEFFFRELTAPIHGTNRTVTIDNWFTTIPLLERMLEYPYKLTITGTIRKNKREIPTEMKIASKTVQDTNFCFSDKER